MHLLKHHFMAQPDSPAVLRKSVRWYPSIWLARVIIYVFGNQGYNVWPKLNIQQVIKTWKWMIVFYILHMWLKCR